VKFLRTLGFIVLLTVASAVAFVGLYVAIAYVAIFFVGLAEPWPRGGEWVLFLARLQMVLVWYAGLYFLGLVMAWPYVVRFSRFRATGHVLASAAASSTMYILINLSAAPGPVLCLILPVAVVVIVFLAAVILASRVQSRPQGAAELSR